MCGTKITCSVSHLALFLGGDLQEFGFFTAMKTHVSRGRTVRLMAPSCTTIIVQHAQSTVRTFSALYSTQPGPSTCTETQNGQFGP